MKFHLPPGASRLSHAGKAVAIAADGTIELDPTQIALLEPHGIVPLGDPAPIERARIDTLSASELAAALAERQIVPPATASVVTLRSLLRQAIAKPSR